MPVTRQQIEQYHCPRYEELPALSLYMDQVLIVLEEALCLFTPDSEKERLVTPTMINNYVKLRLIPSPEKKKYNRDHIATLIIVSILKKVLSMSEITCVMTIMQEEYGPKAAYDLFCDRLEYALQKSFSFSNETFALLEETPLALNAALIALIGKLLVQDCVSRYLEDQPQKPE